MDIADISDRLEIQDLVARFADAVNHMDPSRIRDLCVDEARFVVEGWTSLEGIGEMVGFLWGVIGHWDGIYQAVSSGTVTLDGDTASGSWYITEYGRYSDGNEVFLGGLYEDQYVRTDDGWRFTSRTFHGMFRRSALAGPEFKVRPPLTRRGA